MTLCLLFIANLKLHDDETAYASGQDVGMYELDEECAEIMSVRVNYGPNPSFSMTNLRNNQAIGGIRLFTSELQKVMFFFNELMNLYPDSTLTKFGAPSRVDYDKKYYFMKFRSEKTWSLFKI